MSIHIGQRTHVPPSDKTLKTLKKLQAHWDKVQAGVNPATLRETQEEMRRQIARHDRVPLRGKALRLFDGNENPARTSRRVEELAARLRGEMARDSS